MSIEKDEEIKKLEKKAARVALIVVFGLIIEFSLATFLAFHTLKVNPDIGNDAKVFQNIDE